MLRPSWSVSGQQLCFSNNNGGKKANNGEECTLLALEKLVFGRKITDFENSWRVKLTAHQSLLPVKYETSKAFSLTLTYL